MRYQRFRGAMYVRMLFRAAMLRRIQTAPALIAVIIAAATATAMLNLYIDVQVKLRKEFRNFGANIIVEAAPGQSFSPQALASVNSSVGARGVAVPFAYTVARTANDQPVVIAGTDFDLVKKLNPWWSVSSWPKSRNAIEETRASLAVQPSEALVGIRASRILHSEGSDFTLKYGSHLIDLRLAGTVQTGAGEDSRIYISMQDFRSWTGLEPSVVEIAAIGPPQEINLLMQQLQSTLPSAEVRPVRQVTEGEANILGKTRSTLLSSAAFIVSTAALCVLATLMGWVFDRRRDFAIMKALGASDRLIAVFVSGEAVILALAGASLGFACGLAIATLIGRANFHTPVAPRLTILLPVLGGALAVTLVSTLLPLRLLRRIEPAMILRGE